MREMLKGKIHRAVVTEANPDYEGSVTLDPILMEAADILPYEKVHVLDITNGVRLETYAIRGELGQGQVCMNGAAARLVSRGHRVIILAYTIMSDVDAKEVKPHLVFVDENNRIRQAVGTH